jgi:hypothetical protein
MATWKSTMRTIGSIAREVERDAKRAKREKERRLKELQKLQALEAAAAEVEMHESLVEKITGLHKTCCRQVDWRAALEAKEPTLPPRKDRFEKEAVRRFEAYTPGLLDRAFRRTERVRAKLESSIEEARRRDDDEFAGARRSHQKLHQDWDEARGVAARLLEGDSEAVASVLRKNSKLYALPMLGRELGLQSDQPGTPVIGLQVHPIDVIPSDTKLLLKSGKLSTKPLAKSAHLSLYQDYVCSSVLRVGREALAVLPNAGVIVTAYAELLNSSTGHLEDMAVVSVAMPRATLAKLSFEAVDPSDAMSNFVHRMDFKKVSGFRPIQPLTTDDVDMETATERGVQG